MADPKDKFEDNVPGPYFVDTSCIDCDVGRDTAPANFTRNEEGQYSYVCKQPATPEEAAACAEALISCPVEAIGDDAAQAQPD